MSNKVVYPPNIHARKTTIFLAGSIDQGRASDWQSKLIEMLNIVPELVIYNPRRPDWDASWKSDSPELIEQIKWELDHIKKCDYVFMFFEAGSKSPISLLELGICCASKPKQFVVCCESGYERYTNVAITCDEFNVKRVTKLEEFVDFLLQNKL